MKTFMHVGLPKAASTYLQRVVFPEMAPLYVSVSETQRRWPWMWNLNPFRPGIPKPDIDGHSMTGLSPRETLHLSKPESLGSIDSMARDSQIVSLEGLCGSSWNPTSNSLKNAKVIWDVFGDVQLLLVLRRQDQWFRSIWRQLVIHENRFGTYLTPDEFRQASGLRTSLIELDWQELILTWSEFMGLERITVLPFELLTERPSEFLSEIEAWVGVQLPDQLGTEAVDPQGFDRSWGLRGRIRYARNWPRRQAWRARAQGERFPEYSSELKASNRALSSLVGRDFQEFGY